jgi:hypothetical protein
MKVKHRREDEVSTVSRNPQGYLCAGEGLSNWSYGNARVLCQDWRPLKPAKVEVGQVWQYKGCRKQTVATMAGATNSEVAYASDGDRLVVEAMLLNEYWVWLAEGE